MYLSEEMAFRSKPMVEMAANRRLDAAGSKIGTLTVISHINGK